MSELTATPIVKNKFWVVEAKGSKVATIQAREDGGFVYVHDDQREFFSDVKLLKKKYNIKFTGQHKIKKEKNNIVYGFPVRGKAFNQVYDVCRKLPVYTKTLKSKSFYCAGFYVIKLSNDWTTCFCPKNITLQRYQYFGPYTNESEANNKLGELNEKS